MHAEEAALKRSSDGLSLETIKNKLMGFCQRKQEQTIRSKIRKAMFFFNERRKEIEWFK